MSFTSTQLASEINSDPAAIGYASRVAEGDDAGVAALLNAATATKIFRDDVAPGEIINAIVAADFASLTQLQLSKLSLFFAGNASLDATNANTRTIFTGIFSGMTSTIAALSALVQRPGTRAEVLWGINTTVSADDVSLALRGTQ